MKPVSEQYRTQMNALALTIDELFNGDLRGKERKIGFALMLFEFGNVDRNAMNWISNANKEDMLVALKEMVARLEARVHEGGRA